MQWAIFGIKNVCQGNPQNQQYIRNMQEQGLAKNDFLQDSRVECRMENGRIKMKNMMNDEAS